MHKDARGAAIASLAAQKQGKFWEMHDKMFENMRALKKDNLEAYAKELGLDVE
jgi:protein-disulfide isomerase